jgi:hypothetical protein
MNILEAAEQLGDTKETALGVYAGLIAEYDANNRKPADVAIWEARAKVRPQSVLKIEQPSQNPEPTRGLEPRTPSLRVARDAVRLAFLSHIVSQVVFSDHSRFEEFGTRFGTRFSSVRRSARPVVSDVHAGRRTA